MPVIVTGMSKRLQKKTRKLAPVRPDKSLQKRAMSALDDLISPMTREVLTMAPFLTSGTMGNAALQLSMLLDKWKGIFDRSNAGIAWKWVTSADQVAKDRLQKSISKSMGVESAWILDPPELRASFEGLVSESQALITTIPSDYLGKVGEALLKSYRQERLPDDRSIVVEVAELGKITHERAKVLARDQTSKYNSSLNQIRQSELGISEYIWRTSGDQRVVGDPGGLYPDGNRMHGNHYVRNGKKFKWAEPPFDGHPGWPIQCRCVAEPILNLDTLNVM